MVARTPTEAVEAFFGPLQRAVSVATVAVLSGRAYRSDDAPHEMTFGAGDPVLLGRDRRLALWMRHRYVLERSLSRPFGWSIVTTGYLYRLQTSDGKSVLSYHWHPVGHSLVSFPHLHIEGRTTPIDLAKAHLPTDRVTLTAVLRLLMTDLGVQPLRPDWRDVLDRAEHDLVGES